MRTRSRVLGVLAGGLLALGILSTAVVSLREPLARGDYRAIWGLKARALFRSGSFDALFRVDPNGAFSHPEYPPLWPAVLASAAAPAGRYDDLLVAPLWPLLAVLASLFAFRATKASMPFALLAAAAVSLLPYWRRYPGYAEALLVVLLLAALGEIERLDVDRLAPLRLALFVTLAAWTKSEGLLAAVVVSGALLVARRFRAGLLVGFSVAFLAALPWRLFVARHAPVPPPTDFSLAAFSAGNLWTALCALATEASSSFGWLGGALLLLALAPFTRARRAGVLASIGIYAVALAGSFAFTRLDPVWHVRWSWDRLAFIPVALLLPVLAEALEECATDRSAEVPRGGSLPGGPPPAPVPAS
jgi:hypothetical protein